MNKFLLEGEIFDHKEIERRTRPDGSLAVYEGETLRVFDTCEDNLGPWANKLVTWRVSYAELATRCIFYGDSGDIMSSIRSSVGFAYPPTKAKKQWGECFPLACIKTVARQALERL